MDSICEPFAISKSVLKLWSDMLFLAWCLHSFFCQSSELVGSLVLASEAPSIAGTLRFRFPISSAAPGKALVLCDAVGTPAESPRSVAPFYPSSRDYIGYLGETRLWLSLGCWL